jgi:hypothetical protein
VSELKKASEHHKNCKILDSIKTHQIQENTSQALDKDAGLATSNLFGQPQQKISYLYPHNHLNKRRKALGKPAAPHRYYRLRQHTQDELPAIRIVEVPQATEQ